MRRYIFLFAYDGDPTEGYTSPRLPEPFDKTELVQPDTGDLYPDPPANHVLVGVGCNALDMADYNLAEAERVAAETPSTVDGVDAYNSAVASLPSIRTYAAAVREELVPLMDAAAEFLVSDGFVQVGVSDAL